MEHSIAYDRSVPGHQAKKFSCPNCNKKRFVQFYNFETNEYLPSHFGKCDREDHCGYQQTPWEWLKDNKQDSAFVKRERQPARAQQEILIKEVSKDILVKTMSQYELNNFALYLRSLLGLDVTRALLAKYFIGTAKERGTIFWQVDKLMRVRTGQKIHYKQDGHRDKDNPFPSKRLFTVADGYEPCFFGEHLIWDAPRNAIFALCESEKTAVICSAYYQHWNNRPLYWLATSGMHGFTEQKLKALEGLDVVLVPDFSYTARAYWGLAPMCKRKNDKGVTVVDAEGDLDAAYIPLSKRLLSIGSGVEFFDPFPEVQDGSDLADHILDLPKPVFYERPNFDALVVSAIGKEQPLPPKVNETVYDSGEASKMIYEKHGYSIGGARYDKLYEGLRKQMDMFGNPTIQKLVKMFDLEPQFDY